MRLLRRFRSARTSPYAARQARDDADIAGLLDDLLAPDSPCVDVGAHTGDFLDRFIARAPRGRHVAIEALPDLAADLARRYPDVQVEHCAVGERDAEVTFFRQPERPAWSSLAAGHRPEGTAPGEPINVPMRRLDEIVEVAAFVKIDVEGFEADVLAGLSQPPPALSFEFTTIQRDVALACIERCSAMGYTRFNAALGESQALAGEWMDARDVARWLIELPQSANSGDIYAVAT